jgi:hypothetical protein
MGAGTMKNTILALGLSIATMIPNPAHAVISADCEHDPQMGICFDDKAELRNDSAQLNRFQASVVRTDPYSWNKLIVYVSRLSSRQKLHAKPAMLDMIRNTQDGKPMNVRQCSDHICLNGMIVYVH